MFERRENGGVEFFIPKLRIGGIVVMIGMAAGLAACQSEDESSAGLGGSAPAEVSIPPGAEPALTAPADAAARKLFANALRAVRRRDFSYAYGLFVEAERRHRLRSAGAGDFLAGCVYYQGRCLEGQFKFDEARAAYERVPQASAYRPAAAGRLAALTLDADSDGYSDAWEEAEGTNPQNPLSHP